MSDELESSELEPDVQRLFASLPREMLIDPAAEDRMVTALAAEGFFARRHRRSRSALRIAAAAVLLVGAGIVGGVIGARLTARASLEGMLVRDDLSTAEQVLLLQRAGSAYVRAAHAYANATVRTDSMAAEVARQVLLSAAHAVVRNRLDDGVASRLTTLLRSPVTPAGTHPAAQPSQPVLWF